MTLAKKEREKLIEELGLYDSLKDLRKKIKKAKKPKKKRFDYFDSKKINPFISLSSKIFENFSRSLLKKGYFRRLHLKLRQANFPLLISTYTSLLFAIPSAILLISVPILLILLFTTSFLTFAKSLLLALSLSIITLLSIYFFPFIESGGRKNKINDELPFAITHMAAIAGSGVEPSKIFSLVAESPEYKEAGKEMQKVINRVNFYGYDLLTALKESAKFTPSNKVKKLFNGMATTIQSGGLLKNYLEKKASDSILEYKLARKKYSDKAETYADIYTGLLVTAPLIFGIILAIIQPVGEDIIGFDITFISIIGILAIVIINIIFIVFLNLAQPSD